MGQAAVALAKCATARPFDASQLRALLFFGDPVGWRSLRASVQEGSLAAMLLRALPIRSWSALWVCMSVQQEMDLIRHPAH